MQKKKFIIYRRDARKGSSAYSPERIEDLKAQYECIGNPYNESPKHWIGIDPNSAPDDLLQELTRNSYEIVKAKYASKRGQKQTRSTV